LKAAVLRNHVEDKVTVVEAAVGRKEHSSGTLHCLDWHSAYCKVLPHDDHSLLGTDRDGVSVSNASADSTFVQSVSLDNVVEHMVGQQQVCAIKIDVEGAEEEVIRGGIAFLRERNPLIFLELHPHELRERGSCTERVFDALIHEALYTTMQPFPNVSGLPCKTDVNGFYGATLFQGAEELDKIESVNTPCDCVESCSRHVLHGCRCWNFDGRTRTCTLLRRCATRSHVGGDGGVFAWAGDLHGLWKVGI